MILNCCGKYFTKFIFNTFLKKKELSYVELYNINLSLFEKLMKFFLSMYFQICKKRTNPIPNPMYKESSKTFTSKLDKHCYLFSTCQKSLWL